MPELFDVYYFSHGRYMAFRAMVLALLACTCTWQEAWDSVEVQMAVKPFCGQRGRHSFKGKPSDAIAFLRPYAEFVVSREQVDYLFPEEFAGALHQLEDLVAQVKDLSGLVEALKDWADL